MYVYVHIYLLYLYVFLFKYAGNCQVSVEARNYSYESNQNTLQISLSKYNKINIIGTWWSLFWFDFSIYMCVCMCIWLWTVLFDLVSEDANKQGFDDANPRGHEGKGIINISLWGFGLAYVHGDL